MSLDQESRLENQSTSKTELKKCESAEDVTLRTGAYHDVSGSTVEEITEGEHLPDQQYEVERVLDHELTEDGSFYLVRWKGYTEADDSWEPAENLSMATMAIADYEKSKKAIVKRGKKTPKVYTSKSGKGLTKKQTSSNSVSKRRSGLPKTKNDDSDLVFEETSRSKQLSARTRRRFRASSFSQTLSSARKALQLRQPWLYESDSDEESKTEKGNGKPIGHRKLLAQERKKIQQETKGRQSQQKKSLEVCSETPLSSNRKRQAEAKNSNNSKKSKRNQQGVFLYEKNQVAISHKGGNGAARSACTSKLNVDEQEHIFAIGKTSDGQIKVLIGTDESKRIVSLREAHDANSWELLQHVLQYAVFDSLE